MWRRFRCEALAEKLDSICGSNPRRLKPVQRERHLRSAGSAAPPKSEFSTRRGQLTIRLWRRGLAQGKRILQIAFAEWAAGRHRVDNAAQAHASGIGTGSHD